MENTTFGTEEKVIQRIKLMEKALSELIHSNEISEKR